MDLQPFKDREKRMSVGIWKQVVSLIVVVVVVVLPVVEMLSEIVQLMEAL